MKLSEKIKRQAKTPYQEIAVRHGTTADYVGMIARGRYKAERGKALKIKKELEQLVKKK